MIKLARIVVLLSVFRALHGQFPRQFRERVFQPNRRPLASKLTKLGNPISECSTNSGFSPDSNDCEKYKLCVLGQWREYNCGTSMKYDQTHKRCKGYDPLKERCSPRYQDFTSTALPPQTSSNRQIVEEPVSQVTASNECRTNGEYSLIDDAKCTKYKICEKGKYKTYECSDGLLYNNKFRSCVNPGDSDCPPQPPKRNDFSIKNTDVATEQESITSLLSSKTNVINSPSARQDTCPNDITEPCKKVILCDNLTPRKKSNKHQNSGFFSVIEKFSKQNEGTFDGSIEYPRHVPENRRHVGNKVPILGSKDGKVREGAGDFGFFTAVYECYNNHWALRTAPDDWWFTIIRTVALAIDENARNPRVRRFFVNHSGKKELRVNVAPGTLPHNVDYSAFFDQMANLIKQNINVTGYVDTIRSDFSTSTQMHKIISEITVMSSTQEFFDFTGGTFCGIPNVEMLGTLKDWENLKDKVFQLKRILRKIHRHIHLRDFYDQVGEVCDKLIETYTGSSLNTTSEWWSHIFTKEERHGSGGGTYYNGWFIDKVLNLGSVSSFGSVPTGLVTVPMKLKENSHEENSTLVAGIAGITIDESGNIPIVQAKHGWAMFVDPNSKYNQNINRG